MFCGICNAGCCAAVPLGEVPERRRPANWRGAKAVCGCWTGGAVIGSSVRVRGDGLAHVAHQCG